MERVIIYKCRKNIHVLLLLMAALIFVGMTGNVNVAAATRKMKMEDVGVNSDDNSPIPAAPPSEPEPEPAPSPEAEPEPEPAPTTVTFFMHDLVGGSNPTAKPLSMSRGSSALINPNGLIPPTTSAGSLLNVPFQNGGPLPLTFPSAAIPQSPLFNGQFPATSINPNGFISPTNPSFVNGVGPSIPAAIGAGLPNPNGPVLPLTFPNGFVPSSSTNPLLNGIGINGQNLQFNQFPASLNFPFTSQQGIPSINSPNLLNPLPNSPIPGAGTLGAAPLPLNQPGGQSLGISSSEVIVIEDPLTEGPDKSSGLMGKGVGYYMASPNDPKTLLMTFTAKFEEGSEYEGSTIEFSGEDNTALPEREIAVVGGSGKFQGAKGDAIIETVSNTADETVLKFSVNLTY